MIERASGNPAQPASLQEIFDEFDFLGDRESQIDYLIDLGLELPSLSSEYKTEQYRVHGCQSNVWMYATFDEKDQRIDLRAESDAMIVNGLIAVLLACYQEKTAQEILGLDILSIFNRLGIDRHISPQRKNGLNGMVQRIRQMAEHQQA